MRLEDIIDRLNDCAEILDEHAKEEAQVRSTASFLRRTAIRIGRDMALDAEIALVTFKHELKNFAEDMKH